MFARLKARSHAEPASAPGADPDDDMVAALRRLVEPDPLCGSPEMLAWADDACCKRYLRARDCDPERAAILMRATFKWRASNDIHLWLPARAAPCWRDLEAEAATGKMFVLPSVNAQGRAVIVMRPGLENSADPANNLKYLAYTLERAAATAATAANGDGKFVILIDYAAGQFSLRRAPSLATSKATLAMIQDCYPERLAAAFMCDSPPYFLPVFRLLKPFIDPVTSAKIHWISRSSAATDEVVTKHLDPATTPVEYGGQLRYTFSSETYFSA